MTNCNFMEGKLPNAYIAILAMSRKLILMCLKIMVISTALTVISIYLMCM